MKTTKKATVLATCVKDFDLWGCPTCGYRSGHRTLAQGGTAYYTCGECRTRCMILRDDLTVSQMGIGDPPHYPELQPHPRIGIPAHGRPDIRPKNGGEYFMYGGMEMHLTPGCFVCGGKKGLHKTILGYVTTKTAGERIVTMFRSGAVMHYDEQAPDATTVRIGSCARHLQQLELLRGSIQDGILTRKKVALCEKK